MTVSERPLRPLVPALALLAAAALAPGTAGAVNASKAPVAAEHMAPSVSFGFTPFESQQRFSAKIRKDGVNAGQSTTCSPARPNLAHQVAYRGNGTYTAWVGIYDSKASGCSRKLGERVFTFAINATSGVQRPRRRLLTRNPRSATLKRHALGLIRNDGATAYDVRYGRKAFDSVAATGNGKALLSFARPGLYKVVGRAGASGHWSTFGTVTKVRAVAPFDLGAVSFIDSRGPRFGIKAAVRERTARGRVSVAIRRAGSRRWRSLGRGAIRRGAIRKAFTIANRGRYSMRFRFKGSKTTARGTAHFRFRIL